MCVGFTHVCRGGGGGGVCMCVGDVGVHESPSWENVCIWILWAGMRPKRGSECTHYVTLSFNTAHA